MTTPLWTTRTAVDTDGWTPALGKQATDSATPAYYSVMENGIYMAAACAPRDYAIGAAGAATRFEIHQGDRNFADEATHKDCDRCELMARLGSDSGSAPLIPVGVAWQMAIDYLVEPGDPNTAKWFGFTQHHQDLTTYLPGSPPFALEMVGERLQVRVRWGANGNDGQAGNFNKVIWVDDADIVRGQKFRLYFRGLYHPTAGHFQVSTDGKTWTKYAGPIGFPAMNGVYLAHGIYRATSPEVMAVQQAIANFWLSPLVF